MVNAGNLSLEFGQPLDHTGFELEIGGEDAGPEAIYPCDFKLYAMDDFRRGSDGGLAYGNGLYFRPEAS